MVGNFISCPGKVDSLSPRCTQSVSSRPKNLFLWGPSKCKYVSAAGSKLYEFSMIEVGAGDFVGERVGLSFGDAVRWTVGEGVKTEKVGLGATVGRGVIGTVGFVSVGVIEGDSDSSYNES